MDAPAHRPPAGDAVTIPLVWMLALAAPAHAGLGDASGGVWLDAHGGLAADLHAGAGWTAGLGGWVGRYDDAFAIGRRWGIGVRGAQGYTFDTHGAPPRMRLAGMLDVHRGIDLLVIGLRFGAQVGAFHTSCPDDLGCDGAITGVTAAVDGAIVYRFHRMWGLSLRADVGVDAWRGYAVPAIGVGLGLAFEAPARHRAPEPAELPDPDPGPMDVDPDGASGDDARGARAR